MQAFVDARPFCLDDLVELLGDVVHDAVEIVLLQLLLLGVAQLLHELAQALQAAVEPALVAVLEQTIEGRPQVAVGEQLFGEGLHHFIRRERLDQLGAVPGPISKEHVCLLAADDVIPGIVRRPRPYPCSLSG